MANLTSPLEVPIKDGDRVRIELGTGVKIYRGGAAGYVDGTGYGVPLNIATASMKFAGVWEQTYDNTNGTQGSTGNGWAVLRRSGLALFNQSGITNASVGKDVFFSDDNTVTTTPGVIMAGRVVSIDNDGKAWVDITNAVRASSRGTYVKYNTAASTEIAAASSSAQAYDLTQTIPGNFLRAGDRIRARGCILITGQNSTNTAQHKFFIGTTNITDSGTGYPNTVGTNYFVDIDITVRSVGATGKLYVAGTYSTTSGGKVDISAGEITQDTTADFTINATTTFSAASASNKAKLAVLAYELVPAV